MIQNLGAFYLVFCSCSLMDFFRFVLVLPTCYQVVVAVWSLGFMCLAAIAKKDSLASRRRGKKTLRKSMMMTLEQLFSKMYRTLQKSV